MQTMSTVGLTRNAQHICVETQPSAYILNTALMTNSLFTPHQDLFSERASALVVGDCLSKELPMHTPFPIATATPLLGASRWQLATVTPTWGRLINRVPSFIETPAQRQHRLILECQAIARAEALADDGNFHPDCSL